MSWNETLFTLGGAPAVFWVGTSTKMHSSVTGPVTFFRGTILALGAQAVVWEGHGPEMPPVVPGLLPDNLIKTFCLTFSQQNAVFTCFSMATRSTEIVK